MHRLIAVLLVTSLLLTLPDTVVANPAELLQKSEELAKKDPVAALNHLESIEAQIKIDAPELIPRLNAIRAENLLLLSRFDEVENIINNSIDTFDLSERDRAHFLWLRGDLLFYRGQEREGYKWLNKAAEAAMHIEDDAMLAPILSSRAIAAVELNDLRQAKKDADFLAQLSEQINTPNIQGDIYYTIAYTYEGYQEFTLAKEHYQKALAIYKQVQNQQQISTLLFYLGRISNKTGETTEAIEYFQQSLENAQQSGDLIGEAFAYWGIAAALYQIKDYTGAISYTKAADIILQDSSNAELKVRVLLEWAKAARQLQRYEIAENLLVRAQGLTQQFEKELEKDALDVKYQYAHLLFAREQYEQAYEQLFEYTEQNAEYHKKKRELAVEVARERQQTDLQEKEHQILNKEQQQQQQILKKEQLQTRISSLVAALIAIGIMGFTFLLHRNHKMKIKLQRLTVIDELTQIANRRSIMQRLTSEIERAQRYQATLSIAIFDIDHFKNLNDTLGHVVGDEVLKKVARIAKDLIRKQDDVGRIGGEEFLIVFPHAEIEESFKVCERLRKAVAVATYPGVHDIQPTISIGVAQLEKNESENLDSLFKRADKLLYAAKNDGRNMVVCSDTIKDQDSQ